MRLIILALVLLCGLCGAGERMEDCITNSFLRNAMTNRWLSGEAGKKRLLLENEFGFPSMTVSKMLTNGVLQSARVCVMSVLTTNIKGVEDFGKREAYAVVYSGQDVVFVESDSDAVNFINKRLNTSENLFLHAVRAVLVFGELRGYTLETHAACPTIATNNTTSVWGVILRDNAQGCSISASFDVSLDKLRRQHFLYFFEIMNDGQLVLVKKERL